MSHLKNTSGLILTEALIAVVLLMTATLIASSIIKNALETNALSRDYLVAHNLASEGIEGLKALRSSNWLKCSAQPEIWLNVGVESCAETGEALTEGENYAVHDDADLGWQLELQDVELDLSADAANADAYNLSVNEDGTGFEADQEAVVGESEESNFYRSVIVNSVDEESADFTVNVQWYDRSKVRSLDRNFKLYNFNN